MATQQQIEQQRAALVAREGVVGMRTIRVFGRAGDEQLVMPVVASLAVLDRDETVRQAIEEANQIIRAKQEAGATVMIVVPEATDGEGRPMGRPLGIGETIDPTQTADVLILSRVVGG